MVRFSVKLVAHIIGHPGAVSYCRCTAFIYAAYLVVFLFSEDMVDVVFGLIDIAVFGLASEVRNAITPEGVRASRWKVCNEIGKFFTQRR